MQFKKNIFFYFFLFTVSVWAEQSQDFLSMTKNKNTMDDAYITYKWWNEKYNIYANIDQGTFESNVLKLNSDPKSYDLMNFIRTEATTTRKINNDITVNFYRMIVAKNALMYFSQYLDFITTNRSKNYDFVINSEKNRNISKIPAYKLWVLKTKRRIKKLQSENTKKVFLDKIYTKR